MGSPLANASATYDAICRNVSRVVATLQPNGYMPQHVCRHAALTQRPAPTGKADVEAHGDGDALGATVAGDGDGVVAGVRGTLKGDGVAA